MTVEYHADCSMCGQCGVHLPPIDQWPCLVDGRMLCGSCDCPDTHPEQDD